MLCLLTAQKYSIKKILSRAHEEWGYCQAGTSAILLADKTALIGTPGPYTWRGTVFAVSTDDVSASNFHFTL